MGVAVAYYPTVQASLPAMREERGAGHLLVVEVVAVAVKVAAVEQEEAVPVVLCVLQGWSSGKSPSRLSTCGFTMNLWAINPVWDREFPSNCPTNSVKQGA